MGTLYTYTKISKHADIANIITDVQASNMDNKNIINVRWDADFPLAPTGTLKLLWNRETDWLGKPEATTQDGMWNTDLSDSDKAILDTIVATRAPFY